MATDSTDTKRALPWVLLSAVYFLGICAYVARLNMMWVDEFCSWNVLSDPSWRHAFASYSNGADSGGILFYALGRTVLAMVGPYPAAIRVCSSLLFWTAGLLWWGTLRRMLSTFAATVSVLTVWLGSALIFFHAGEVRFYGLFFFTFTLAAVHLLRIGPARPTTVALCASTFLVHVLLITSHTIGLVYSGVLLVVVWMSRSLRSQRWLLTASMVASWSVLAFVHQALSQQARISWMAAPTLRDFFRYYTKSPLAGALPDALLFLVLTAGVVVAIRSPAIVARFKARLKNNDTPVLLAVALLLIPPLFAVVSHAVRPIAADRYMMPAICGFLLAFAGALFALEERNKATLSARSRAAVYLALGLWLVGVHVLALRSVPLRSRSELAGLQRLREAGPIVLDDTNAFFQLRYYAPQASQPFVQLADDASLATPLASGNAVLLAAGYLHQVFGESAFLAQHQTFLFIDTDPTHASWKALAERHPALRGTAVGQVAFAGRAVPLLRVTNTTSR